MKKLIAVALAAVTAAYALTSNPAPAEARRGWGGAFAGALIGGAIVGAIIASQHRRKRHRYYAYRPGPRYYAYQPAYAYYAPRRYHRHRHWW